MLAMGVSRIMYRIGCGLASLVIVLLLISDFHPEDQMNFELSEVNLAMPATMDANRDSFQKVNTERRERVMATGGGWNFGFVGLRSVVECDTCAGSYAADNLPTKHYWQFSGFAAPRLSASFFEEKQFYKGREHLMRLAFQEEERPYPVSLLIPLSERSFQIWRVILLIVVLLLALYALYSILSVVRVFEHIAIGKAFDAENHLILKRAARVLLVLGLWKPLGSLLVFWLFGTRAGLPLEYSFWFDIFNHRFILIGSLLLFLLALAFRRGYALQQDHSLTV